MPPAVAAPKRALLLLALVAATLLSPAATAAEATPRTVHLDYTVKAESPESGVVHVRLAISGAEGVIERFTFVTASHQYPVSNLSAEGGTLTERSDGAGHTLTLDSPVTTLKYSVKVARNSTRADEYNAYLGPEWGVFKAESLALGFNVRHDARYDPVWDATVSFSLPAGWNAQGPWAPDGPLAFQLPRDEALPRGFVALGRFQLESRTAAGKTFRYVELGEAPPDRADIFPYLERATPYYEAVYGNHTGDVILVISAPDPMFRGGLAGHDSLYVHESTSVVVLAHEYAHVWQRWQSVERPGESSIWLNEGDADYHGPLSLVAAEIWGPGDADDHFRRERDLAEERGELRQPLTAAAYGGEWEKVAYRKGSLVFHELDQRLNLYTDGRVRLPDVMQALNGRYSEINPDYKVGDRVTNGEFEALVLELAGEAHGEALGEFFDGYVRGTKAPQFTTVRQQSNVAFKDVSLDPPTGREGAPSTLRFAVENRGVTAESRQVVVYVNGSAHYQENVTLERLERREMAVPLPDLPPGDYPVRVSYLSIFYRVLTPPDLSLARVSFLPASPAAGETVEALVTVRNDGGAPGGAVVTAHVGGEEVARVAHEAPGGLRETVSLQFAVPTPGEHDVEVRLALDGEVVDTHRERLTVAVPDGDGDGVPDDADAYPDDDRFSEETAVSRAVKAVPAPAPLALAALAAAARALRRRDW